MEEEQYGKNYNVIKLKNHLILLQRLVINHNGYLRLAKNDL